MNRFFVSTVLAGCLGYIPSSLLAEEHEESAPDIVISTGLEGGGYWSAGERFQTVAGEMNLGVEIQASTGSLENIDQLINPQSAVNMGFVQADALQHFLNGSPDEGKKLEVLENIGLECVFMVTTVNSSLRTEEDLQDASNVRLGIPSATSGIAVTFNYMVSQIPELQDVEVVYGDGGPAIDQLGATGAGADVVMTVHRPKEHSEELDAALNYPQKYRLIPLNDSRLTVEMPDGSKVYRSMNLALPGAMEPVQTICVQGLVVYNKEKLSHAQRNTLGALVDYHWIKVYATP